MLTAVFGDRPANAGQFLEQPYTRLPVVDRREESRSQPIGQLVGIDAVILVAALRSAFLPGSHTTTLATQGFSRSYNHVALVPSSKVTDKAPCSPWINSRMVPL